MIIDFHAHIFPDKIAKATVELLEKKSDNTAFSDGTVAGLLGQMREGDISLAVTLPVLTKPTQFDTVNRYASEINDRFAKEQTRLISFAGIHPACEELDKKMKAIKEQGFLGVKIHPDYQETFITDERYLRILECAKEYDLVVVTHAGVDGAYRSAPVRCPPHLAKEVIRKVPHVKLVLAHMGGNECFSEVSELLCGEDVYFDTAYVLQTMDDESFLKILNRHGSDKILFGSDSPWSGMAQSVARLRSLAPDKTTEDQILWQNAKALLGI